jgi:hypothetical protein
MLARQISTHLVKMKNGEEFQLNRSNTVRVRRYSDRCIASKVTLIVSVAVMGTRCISRVSLSKYVLSAESFHTILQATRFEVGDLLPESHFHLAFRGYVWGFLRWFKPTAVSHFAVFC